MGRRRGPATDALSREGSMLVICANWAITDGTLAGSAGIDARAWLHEAIKAKRSG